MSKGSRELWFDQSTHLIDPYESFKRNIPASNMFLIKQGLSTFQLNNPNEEWFDCSQGDGGASLGGISNQEKAEAILKDPKTTSCYGTPNGNPKLRDLIIKNVLGFDEPSGFSAEHVVICDGGRDALQKLWQAIHLLRGYSGETILTSNAPWISYAHGSYLSGFNLLRSPKTPWTIGQHNSYKMTPSTIKMGVTISKEYRRRVAVAVITTPDNPTGTTYCEQELVELIEQCSNEGIEYILIDCMYQYICDEGKILYRWNKIMHALDVDVRKKVILLDGLTKSIGASDVRMAYLVSQNTDLIKTITSIASHSVLPNTLAEALAFCVYQHPVVQEHPWVKRIQKPTAQSREILRQTLTAQSIPFILDQGYYAFIRLDHYLRPPFSDMQMLIQHLCQHYGIALVHGTPFRQPYFARFSYALKPEHTQNAVNRLFHALHEIEEKHSQKRSSHI